MVLGSTTRGIGRQGRAVGVRAARLLRVGARPVASVRDAFRADLRRSLRPYWARHSRWTAAFGVYVVVAGAVGVVTHWLVTVVMLVPFGVEAARLRWRARPGWGRAAGLPPGSVGVGVGPIMRFDALANAAGRYGPVFKSNYYGTPMVGIADLPTGTELLRANAADLGFRPNWFNHNIPGGAIRWAPEPRHTELRRMFTRAMSPRCFGEWVPVLDGIVRAVLAQQAAVEAGAAPRDFLLELSTQVCTAFLFGCSRPTRSSQRSAATWRASTSRGRIHCLGRRSGSTSTRSPPRSGVDSPGRSPAGRSRSPMCSPPNPRAHSTTRG